MRANQSLINLRVFKICNLPSLTIISLEILCNSAPNGGNYHIRNSGTFLLSSGIIEQRRWSIGSNSASKSLPSDMLNFEMFLSNSWVWCRARNVKIGRIRSLHSNEQYTFHNHYFLAVYRFGLATTCTC